MPSVLLDPSGHETYETAAGNVLAMSTHWTSHLKGNAKLRSHVEIWLYVQFGDAVKWIGPGSQQS